MRTVEQILNLDELINLVAEFADSQPGKEYILNLSPEFTDVPDDIFRWIKSFKKMNGQLPEMKAIKKINMPAPNDYFSPEELRDIKAFLQLVASTKNVLEEASIVPELWKDLDPIDSLTVKIDKCIDEEASIKKDASEKLKGLYLERESLKKDINDILERVLEEKGELVQEKIITIRSGRTVLPVMYNRRSEIKGIEVDLSRSGNTAFIEPDEVIPLDNRLKENHLDIEEEKERLLREITSEVKENYESLSFNIRSMTLIDSIKARVNYAERYKCVVPEFTENPTLKLKKCRHPLLMREREVVPLDLSLGGDRRTLLVSGPNAGGKTVLLKTVGLNVLSSYAGLPIPAREGTEIGSFNDVFAIIEDEQSLQENLSTFSSFVIRMKEILQEAGSDSLILCDELGGNTDPEEGAALSISILEELTQRGSLIVATTHLNSLKYYVADSNNMVNGSMEYRDHPTYRLLFGIPGGSRAISVAEQYGLPQNVIKKAKNRMDSELLNIEELLTELEKRKNSIQKKEKRVHEMESELEELTSRYRKKMESMKKEEKKIIEESREEANRIVNEARSKVEKTIKEIKEKNASKKSIENYRKTFNEFQKKEERKKEKIIPGDKKKSKVRYDVDTQIPLEISVRGKTRDQAWREIDKFLDRAMVSGYERVRIVHGKGSWVLRDMVHDRLERDLRVTDIFTPSQSEGGEGVTVAKLK